jgi:hypothetical protein
MSTKTDLATLNGVVSYRESLISAMLDFEVTLVIPKEYFIEAAHIYRSKRL